MHTSCDVARSSDQNYRQRKLDKVKNSSSEQTKQIGDRLRRSLAKCAETRRPNVPHP
jgi:hypothetical protein